MGEAKSCRVQKISMGIPEFLRELFRACLAVDIVAHDRMTDRSQVYSNLVGSARFDLYLHHCEFTELFHHPILGVG